jgi:hypothetical protein
MKRVMVRYKVKAGRAAENEELVRAVYDELRSSEPAGIRYSTFALADGVSFVHVAAIEDEEHNPLARVQAFKRFQENIGERCEEPPVVSELREVGSYASPAISASTT